MENVSLGNVPNENSNPNVENVNPNVENVNSKVVLLSSEIMSVVKKGVADDVGLFKEESFVSRFNGKKIELGMVGPSSKINKAIFLESKVCGVGGEVSMEDCNKNVSVYTKGREEILSEIDDVGFGEMFGPNVNALGDKRFKDNGFQSDRLFTVGDYGNLYVENNSGPLDDSLGNDVEGNSIIGPSALIDKPDKENVELSKGKEKNSGHSKSYSPSSSSTSKNDGKRKLAAGFSDEFRNTSAANSLKPLVPDGSIFCPSG
ncbi:hypothetical protein ACOSQ3_024579 [Xanthoceras sorbifolium]